MTKIQSQATVWWLPKGMGEGVVKGKGGQIHSDERFDFGWWVHNVIYKSCIIELYMLNLYNLINHCHPNKCN